MKTPEIPVSWGEFFDKLSILQIKLEKLTSKNGLRNVKKEHARLNAILLENISHLSKVTELLEELRAINLKLWNIEDKIRDKERRKMFDEEFIQLARSVYFTNDQRARIKKNINTFLASDLVEEKFYTDY